MVNEAVETDSQLETYLAADSTLMGMLNGGIFSTFFGTTNSATPLVRFFQVESSDLMVNDARRVWAEIVYQVEAVTSGYDISTTQDIAQRLDELLHRLQGQTWGSVYVQEIFRRAPLFRREVTSSGDEYAFAGGEYVVRVSST